MTIITKPITEKKKLEQPLVINEHDPDAESAVVPPLYVYRKRNSWVLLLAALLFLSVGIVGSLLVYQMVNHVQNRPLRRLCHIPYESSAYMGGPKMFTEEFDIDLEQNYASVRVPDFSGGRSGRFVHDFNFNLTGIIDMEGRRCFVMPLNRKQVLPPTDLQDLVMKLYKGYYEVDMKNIRERMRVVLPSMSPSEVNQIGPFIGRECMGKPVYRLVKETKILYKRSVDGGSVFFAELAGPNMQQFDVVNMAAVEEFEKQQQAVGTDSH